LKQMMLPEISDIVSLHRGLTENTRHCLGAAELAKLRPGAIPIDVARGALIEPAALLARQVLQATMPSVHSITHPSADQSGTA